MSKTTDPASIGSMVDQGLQLISSERFESITSQLILPPADATAASLYSLITATHSLCHKTAFVGPDYATAGAHVQKSPTTVSASIFTVFNALKLQLAASAGASDSDA